MKKVIVPPDAETLASSEPDDSAIDLGGGESDDSAVDLSASQEVADVPAAMVSAAAVQDPDDESDNDEEQPPEFVPDSVTSAAPQKGKKPTNAERKAMLKAEADAKSEAKAKADAVAPIDAPKTIQLVDKVTNALRQASEATVLAEREAAHARDVAEAKAAEARAAAAALARLEEKAAAAAEAERMANHVPLVVRATGNFALMINGSLRKYTTGQLESDYLTAKQLQESGCPVTVIGGQEFSQCPQCKHIYPRG